MMIIYKIIAICCAFILLLTTFKVFEQLFFYYLELHDEEELQCGDKVHNLSTDELCIFLCMDDTDEDSCIVIDDVGTDYIHISKESIDNIDLVR